MILFSNIAFAQTEQFPLEQQKKLENNLASPSVQDAKQPDPDLVQGLLQFDANPKESLTLCNKALQKNPDNQYALLCVIRNLIVNEQFDDAQKYMAIYKKKFASDRLFLIEQARYEVVTGNYQQGGIMLDSLLKSDPANNTLLDLQVLNNDNRDKQALHE